MGSWTSTIKHFLAKHPFMSFFGLAFGISWGIWVPLVLLQVEHPIYKLGTFGPTLAALLLIASQGGEKGLLSLWRKLTLWRVDFGWYLFSLFAAVPVLLVGIWLDRWLGGPSPEFNDPAQIYLVIPAFLYVLFTSVLGEEIGWRGFALPKLLQESRAVTAGLILGGIWGVWHLPLFSIPGNFHVHVPLLPFVLQILAFSVLYTWMYIHTEGNLLLPHLFHTASNTALGVLPVLPMDTGGRTRPMWLALGLWCFFVAGIIFIHGTTLKRK